MRNSLSSTAMLLFLSLISSTPVRGQDAAACSESTVGTVAVIDVPAPALAGSLLRMPTAERTAVYLPPSYDVQTQKRYPVVYYLPGFMDQIFLYSHVPYYQGFLLREAMDRLIAEKKIAEMIVIIPNGLTPLGGSFYVNSPINGNWEDFIVDDLVGAIDSSFRTVAAPEARAIAGHSMGGFGALNLGMHHPDVFAAVYALSPGLAAPGGLESHPSFANAAARQRICEFLASIDSLPDCEREVRLLAEASYWNQTFDTAPLFALAYSAAFSPAQPRSGIGLEYPYRLEGGDFVRDAAGWERFERGFGNWEEKIRRNLSDLRHLSYIAIDVGDNDEHAWIPAGCRHVSRLLTEAGVPNELMVHPGGHEDTLRERLETMMFPALSRCFADAG